MRVWCPARCRPIKGHCRGRGRPWRSWRGLLGMRCGLPARPALRRPPAIAPLCLRINQRPPGRAAACVRPASVRPSARHRGLAVSSRHRAALCRCRRPIPLCLLAVTIFVIVAVQRRSEERGGEGQSPMAVAARNNWRCTASAISVGSDSDIRCFATKSRKDVR